MQKIIKIILFTLFSVQAISQNISIKQIRHAPDSLMIIISDAADENHFSYAYIKNYTGIDSVYIRNDSLCWTQNTIEYCDSLPMKENQTLSIDSIGRVFTISLLHGGSVKFKDKINDADSSYVNELQDLFFDQTTDSLHIQYGNTVDLSSINTDNQALDVFSIESGATGGTISISHDNNSATQSIDIEESVEDLIGANIIGGTDISTNYDDATGQTTINYTGSSGADGNGIYSGSGTLTNDVTISQSGHDILIDGGTSDGQLKIDGTGSGYTHSNILMTTNSSVRGTGIYMRDVTSSTNWYIGRPYNSNDAFTINRNTGGGYSSSANPVSSQFYINTTGIGINNTNPSYGLDVTGTFHVTSVSEFNNYIDLISSTPTIKFDRTADDFDWTIKNNQYGTITFNTTHTSGSFKITSGTSAAFEYNANSGQTKIKDVSGIEAINIDATNHVLTIKDSSNSPKFELDGQNQKIKINNTAGTTGDVITVTNVSGKTEFKTTLNFGKGSMSTDQYITSGGYTLINFNVEDFEKGDIDVDAVNHEINIGANGYYRVTYKCVQSQDTGGGQANFGVFLNGNLISNSELRNYISGNDYAAISFSDLFNFTNGDKITFRASKSGINYTIKNFSCSIEKIHQ